MIKLSSSITRIKPHYTVVVIGSGYGGGIVASRLARAGQQVCLLERGKEFRMGEFPNTLLKAIRNVQLDMKAMHLGSKTGLFEYHLNKDMNTLTGCGLGGTSLINAGVILKADPRVFENKKWPKGLIEDLDHGMQEGYERAEEMLAPSPYPDNFPKLKKIEAMQRSAEYINEKFYLPPIAVTFEKHTDGKNPQGVEQNPCILCGDCVIGCNHTSKNTVQMNYLPDASNHGAEIFSEISVRYVEKRGKKWLVYFESTGAKREIFHAPNPFVTADIVILAAGTLGSTEILLRSSKNGLPLPGMLGKNLTANGGSMGIGYNLTQKVNAVGYGTRSPDPENPPGPSITGIIDTRNNVDNYRDGMSIEETAIPGEVSSIMPISFIISKIFGKRTESGTDSRLSAYRREITSLFRGSYHGAMNQTLTYLGMTHDSAQGVMYLEKDRLRIKWPDVGKEPVFKKVQQRFKEMTKALGGTFIPNPIWSRLFGNKIISVHPMGGCVMAEDAACGVVNHKGQVFSSNAGQDVHNGLYVSDGSIIPTSLGTNPILTISAVAERNAVLLAREYGWKINYDLSLERVKKAIRPQQDVGLQFTETMTGFFSSKEKNDYKLAAKLGKQEGSIFEFTLTIVSEDIRHMLKDENHQASMFGTVNAPALSDKPLMVTDGIFNLFVKNADYSNIRRMNYRMKLYSQEGKYYFVNGFKLIRHASILSLWGDTTTLYITVHNGKTKKAAVLGKGIINIRLLDFVKQSTTLSVNNAAGKLESLKVIAQFGSFFTRKLFEKYSGILSGWEYYNADAAPRQTRPLRVSAAEVHEFETDDHVKLRLTRYRGGSKGPVILTHGAGVSSKIFSIDTVDTNLLEYLFAHEYDVWLLDYRTSIELSSTNMQSTADDVARYDYPAAVDTVLKISGADSVQFVAHCYGATTLTMSLLGGWLKRVRSVVISQVSAHTKVPMLTRLKTGIHMPSMLSRMGINSLTANVSSHSTWPGRVFNWLLGIFQPIKKGERCNNPVCYRITFMYGQLYEHAQINQLTHENMHEMFGVTNMTTLKHLALIIRKGHLVNAQGEDSYMPQLQRMAIPITFISGDKNACYLPESTEFTFNQLCDRNGDDLYQRVVIPSYGHIDCIFGKNAVNDVYPFMLDHLDTTNVKEIL